MIPEQYKVYAEKYDKRAKLHKEMLELQYQIRILSMKLAVESKTLAKSFGQITMDTKLQNKIGQILTCEDIQTDIHTDNKERIVVRTYKFINEVTASEHWLTEHIINTNDNWTIMDKSLPKVGKSMKFKRVVHIGNDADSNKNLYIGIGAKVGVIFKAHMHYNFDDSLKYTLKYSIIYDHYYLMMQNNSTEEMPSWRRGAKNIRVAERVVIKKLITNRAEITAYLL